MSYQIIYEKKFPRIDIEALKAELDANKEEFEELPGPDYEAFLAYHYNATTWIPLPKKQAGAQKFIDVAIAVSNCCETDIRIEQADSHITARLSFDCGGGSLHDMKPLLALADELRFSTGMHEREITVTVTYYTQAEIRCGMVMAPPECDLFGE